MKKQSFLKAFLLTYAVLLIYHFEPSLESWQMIAAVLAGTVITLVSHGKHGYLPLVFLLIHMVSEWYSHGLHGNEYRGNEILLHGIHAVFDLSFLVVTTRSHHLKHWVWLLTASLLITGTSFLIGDSTMHTSHHEHGDGVLNHFIFGGIMGCIFSHFFYFKKWQDGGANDYSHR